MTPVPRKARANSLVAAPADPCDANQLLEGLGFIQNTGTAAAAAAAAPCTPKNRVLSTLLRATIDNVCCIANDRTYLKSSETLCSKNQ